MSQNMTLTPGQDAIACLVTGCAGFVGSHLTQALLDLGCRVVGVDNLLSGKMENMAGFEDHPGFVFRRASIEEPGLWDRLFPQDGPFVAVFHLAAIVSVPYSMQHEEETYEINERASLRLLAAAELNGARRFVFAGSAAEYGAEDRLPIREEYADETTVQLSPYGRAKYLVTRAVAESPIGVSLRFFNIYGPRQDPASPYSGVISKFMACAAEDQALTIFGNGEQSRDFVFVQDVVDAYLAAAGLRGGPLAPGIYNVGAGHPVKILTLGWLILVLTGKPYLAMTCVEGEERTPEGEQVCLFYPVRSGDIPHSVADVGRLTAAGWSARTVLSLGLARTIAWYRPDLLVRAPEDRPDLAREPAPDASL